MWKARKKLYKNIVQPLKEWRQQAVLLSILATVRNWSVDQIIIWISSFCTYGGLHPAPWVCCMPQNVRMLLRVFNVPEISYLVDQFRCVKACNSCHLWMGAQRDEGVSVNQDDVTTYDNLWPLNDKLLWFPIHFSTCTSSKCLCEIFKSTMYDQHIRAFCHCLGVYGEWTTSCERFYMMMLKNWETEIYKRRQYCFRL